MAIDPSIALQVRTARVADPLEGYGRVLSLKNMLQAGEMNQQQLKQAEMQTAQMQRAADEDQAVRGAFQAAGGDARKALPGVMSASPKTGLAIAKQLGEQDKAGLEFKKMRLEHDLKASEYIGQQLGGVRDQASYDMARERIAAAGLPVDQMPPMFSPQLVDGYIQKGLSIKDRIDQEWKKLDYELRGADSQRAELRDQRDAARFEAEMPGVQADVTLKQMTAAGKAPIQPAEAARIAQGEQGLKLTARGQDMSAATARAGQAVTMRGQNMTDIRARELNTITRENKPPSEGERAAFGYYTRALDAHQALEGMEEQMASKGVMEQLGYNYLPNMAQSEENQLYRQAQRQFTEARLRKDSGAAIAASEYANDEKTYFPQPGDTKAVLERKRQARTMVLRSLKDQAGRAYREDVPGSGAAAGAAPAVPAASAAPAAPAAAGGFTAYAEGPGGKRLGWNGSAWVEVK
jgi:hypothetical protein